MAAPERVVVTVPQWQACAHHQTSLLPAGADARGVGVVTVCPVPDPPPAESAPEPVERGGLAIAPNCYAYHAVPEDARLDQLVWLPAEGRTSDAEPLLATPASSVAGEFHPATPADDPLRFVVLAVDRGSDGSRLWALEAGGDVVCLDLGSRRLVRRLRLQTPDVEAGPWTATPGGRPLPVVDLAAGADAVFLACASRAQPLWRVTWHGDPVEVRVPPRTLTSLPAGFLPERVAADDEDRVWLLWQASGQPGWATPVLDDRTTAACGPLPGATDLELDGAGRLVVATGAGADLRTFVVTGDTLSEDRPLRARRADGRGLARTPDGRIAFWTADGVRVAHGAPVRYQPEGWLVTVALDSGAFRQRWGRVFVDACIPPGTDVSVAFLTSDDLPGDELDGFPLPLGESLTVEHTPPCHVVGPPAPTDPFDLPLPAADSLDRFGPDRPLYRREAVEQPWLQPRGDDPFVTYEAPVNASPGRYLWLRLRLRATGLRTPRVRALRAESAGPRLLERLPRVYTEDAVVTGFLDRFLTLANEPMADLGAAADARHVLLDPTSAPAQLLPWLASLVGLTLDPRWPEPARRTMIAQAVPLFRRRGTIGALLTMLEIVLGVRPVLVEGYQFRGLTGAVGTTLVRTGSAFDEYAHRFSLVIPGALSADLLSSVTDLVTEHRPAHTTFEICSARSGSRLGIGLHLGLTSVIGRSGGWTELAVGGVLGRDAVLGQPSAALRVGAGGIGLDARVEP